MVRMFDMRQKEVINICDGARLGFVADVEIDEECGKIIKIIVPGQGKLFGIFGRDQEFRIPWERIKKMGDDVILVDAEADKILVGYDD